MWNNQNGVFKAFATLRVHGVGLAPDGVTAQLGLGPSKSGIHKGYGMWNYSTEHLLDTLLPLERHVRFITELVKPHASALRQLQQQYKTDVFCYFASESDCGGFSLPPGILSDLGELGLTFDVDEYFCCASTDTNEKQMA